MFEDKRTPRVYALPPGVDFPKALVEGLLTRFGNESPETLARVQLVVNTKRMARRIRDLFDRGPARLLPKISLLTAIAPPSHLTDLPPAVSPLRRRLELAQLVSKLLDREPDLAARSSIYGFADSLAELIDEMQGEGVSPEVIRDLDVSDMSGHWARAQRFFEIATQYLDGREEPEQGAQAYQRYIIQNMIDRWETDPPEFPMILAGSTGSRGTTAMLMAAVARLPQGAIVLPGYDFDQPERIWSSLDEALQSDDHPQFRFRKLMNTLDVSPADVVRWSEDQPPSPNRNRLVSLALRPAPVTDAWLREGPSLEDLEGATSEISIVEAAEPRNEALAIALRLRQAVENNQTAALITPDRMLTRQVSAALDRWDIIPDDSAGLPLQLSPPGRFLRHVASLFSHKLTGEKLLTLLKHPLCHEVSERGMHLLYARDLELYLRRHGPPFPTALSLAAVFPKLKNGTPEVWVEWLCSCFCDLNAFGKLPLSTWVSKLRNTAESIAAGSDNKGSGALWDKNAGQKALAVLTELETEAAFGGEVTAQEFSDLLSSLLANEEVRDRDAPHEGIMIWGTLEARVQGADLVILGGLNEGSWPEAPSPDPWLNRRMREQAGLLLPERRIGLSAHDFQQAICAPEVWLTRSIRSEDADTVPSRWLNRLANLLNGLPSQNGPKALSDMKARGQIWLNWVDSLEEIAEVEPVSRPSPRPPVLARPNKLSVTEIKTLIRDPYAIYAKHVLKLRPLEPLVQSPDALLRGIAVHDFLEAFIRNSLTHPDQLTGRVFLEIANQVLQENVPWPAARRLWLARLERLADKFLEKELVRRSTAVPAAFEAKMSATLKPLNFTLTGRADRIDRDSSGHLNIYDYKTGSPPSRTEQAKFDKQLLIEAAVAEQWGFEHLDPAPVSNAVFIGVGSDIKEVPAPIQDEPGQKVLEDLRALISAYFDPGQGYTSRRMLQKDTNKGNFDHLARFGEWNQTNEPVPEDLK